MTEQEVLNELRIIRFRPTVRSIAEQAGVSRNRLYDLIARGKLTPHYKQAVERVLVRMSLNGMNQNRRSPQQHIEGAGNTNPTWDRR